MGLDGGCKERDLLSFLILVSLFSSPGTDADNFEWEGAFLTVSVQSNNKLSSKSNVLVNGFITKQT